MILICTCRTYQLFFVHNLFWDEWFAFWRWSPLASPLGHSPPYSTHSVRTHSECGMYGSSNLSHTEGPGWLFCSFLSYKKQMAFIYFAPWRLNNCELNCYVHLAWRGNRLCLHVGVYMYAHMINNLVNAIIRKYTRFTSLKWQFDIPVFAHRECMCTNDLQVHVNFS